MVSDGRRWATLSPDCRRANMLTEKGTYLGYQKIKLTCFDPGLPYLLIKLYGTRGTMAS